MISNKIIVYHKYFIYSLINYFKTEPHNKYILFSYTDRTFCICISWCDSWGSIWCTIQLDILNIQFCIHWNNQTSHISSFRYPHIFDKVWISIIPLLSFGSWFSARDHSGNTILGQIIESYSTSEFFLWGNFSRWTHLG